MANAALVDPAGRCPSGQLLDVVEGSDTAAPALRLDARDLRWLAGIRWAVPDMSGPYKAVFDCRSLKRSKSSTVPCRETRKLDAGRVPWPRLERDPRHRGRKGDPLYR